MEKSGGVVVSGPVNNPLALRHERLQGKISKYVMSSGTGFVKSNLFEGELGFKTESIMLECQSYEFKEGEGVEFDVQADERGRPHAVALKPIVGRKPTDCIGQRHRGYVRRFADRWGFLNAAAFDGDLFVHRDNLLLVPDQLQDGQPPLRTGQAVEFDVATDDRGRTVAKQITTSALLRPCDWIGRRLQGVIRSFQGAWGFVNSDKFAGDLFVHRDALLQQCQDVELAAGTVVEFDVERDHHKKSGKNRLVARQVSVIQHAAASPPTSPHPGSFAPPFPGGMPPQPMIPQPGMDPMSPYGAPMPQPGYPMPQPGYPPQPPMYYHGAPPPMPDQPYAYGQPPPPFPYDPYAAAAAAQHHAMMQPGMPPPLPQQPVMPPYGQPAPAPGAPQPQFQPPPMAAAGAPPQGQPPMTQPAQQPPFQQVPFPGAAPQAAMPGAAPAPGASTEGPANGESGGEGTQVLLHITTHDWEPDQSGQLRVRKGTLVNVSHRAAHGWVYAATVKHGEQAHEPPSEGWVPQAVAKRVSLCRVAADWPEEGAGTLGLTKGDLIAVSKEAERGWVYGERISPKRPDTASDGWLPKKVLEYILV
eukprot:TRINITY_DN78549_c0_g1_i1.p1 TRINITY_DN78549_c0_g1~~TRINITY_DN78549_c0_g1_i1.p1  ORF type:complete len:662 (-),score=109.55 TRINITY_DN78549_c0_g1_i1:77-1837(-)